MARATAVPEFVEPCSLDDMAQVLDEFAEQAFALADSIHDFALESRMQSREGVQRALATARTDLRTAAAALRRAREALGESASMVAQASSEAGHRTT